MKYLLFDGNNSQLGTGAHGFLSAHETQESAESAGIAFIQCLESGGGVSLSQWVHLASFDGNRMRVIRLLNIPDTEYAQSDVLQWIEA